MHDLAHLAQKRREAARKGAQTRAAQQHARTLWEQSLVSADLAHLTRDYRASLQAAHEARTRLSRALTQQQRSGAKIQDLMDATGYSRRRIQQLLADGRKEA